MDRPFRSFPSLLIHAQASRTRHENQGLCHSLSLILHLPDQSCTWCSLPFPGVSNLFSYTCIDKRGQSQPPLTSSLFSFLSPHATASFNMADSVVKPISTPDITTAAAKSSEETDAMNGNGSVAAAWTTAEKGSESQPADGFDPAADIDVNNNIPTAADLAKCKDLLVLAADGSSRTFKSLYSGEGVATRQLIIFVRHFFCGVGSLPSTSLSVPFPSAAD